jgi:hypothetical protein
MLRRIIGMSEVNDSGCAHIKTLECATKLTPEDISRLMDRRRHIP